VKNDGVRVSPRPWIGIAALAAYLVVVVPTLYSVTNAHAAAIAAAATGGAQVVVTFFSGISDEHDHVRLDGYPGAFRDLLKVRAEEFFPLRPGETVELTEGHGSLWSEDLTATGAEVVTSYAAGPLAGKAAVTRAEAGQGAAWYLATLPDDATLGALLDRLVEDAGVRPVVEVPRGVDAVRGSTNTGVDPRAQQLPTPTRQSIGASLTNINSLTAQTTDLLRLTRPSIQADIKGLRALTTNLNKPSNTATFEKFLSTSPGKISQITRTATYGSWFNFYMCDFSGTITLPAGPAVQLGKPDSLNAARCS